MTVSARRGQSFLQSAIGERDHLHSAGTEIKGPARTGQLPGRHSDTVVGWNCSNVSCNFPENKSKKFTVNSPSNSSRKFLSGQGWALGKLSASENLHFRV